MAKTSRRLDGMTYSKRIPYRRDLESLRAFAVLMVVGFHTAPETFQSGFLGVDVFFVISGFLITSILSDEITAGVFSLQTFWERRARRLLPAAIAVLVAVSAFVLMTRPPTAVRYFGESISHAVLLLSDLFFYNESDYFGREAKQQPLLHFWSLAVEAKFYIALPLVFLAFASRSRRFFTVAIGSLFVLSLAACLYYVAHDPSAAFYLTPLRLWEFAAGILLALSVDARSSRWHARAPLWTRDLALLGTVTGLVCATFLLNPTLPHPGIGAFTTVICAAIAILAGERSETEVTLLWRLYTNPAIVSIGLISYSLYLWHWPVLVFVRDIAITPLEPLTLAIALFTSVLIATMSFLFIEKPFRRGRKPASSHTSTETIFATTIGLLWSWRTPLVVMFVALAGGGFLQSTKGWPGRFSNETLAIVSEDRIKRGVVYLRCPKVEEPAPAAREARPFGATLCRLGDPAAPITVAIWGDSHGDALSPAVDTYLRSAQRSGIVSVRGACGPLLDFKLYDTPARRDCWRLNQEAPRYWRAVGVRTVLLAMNWRNVASADMLSALAALDRSIEALTPFVDRIVLATPAPNLDYDAASRMFVGHVLKLPSPPPTPLPDYEMEFQDVLDHFKALAERRNDVVILEQHRAVCSAAGCYGYEKGENGQPDLPLYADKSHINAAGISRLIGRIAEAFSFNAVE